MCVRRNGALPGTAFQAGADVVGGVEVSRPYYLCPRCQPGQFPVDRELEMENTAFSPGVRSMQATVAPFEQGCEQMRVLAGLEVTAKSVERTAEGVGADIARREQVQVQQALQLDLPVAVANPIPIL
ncbi:MAG: hypothetical protein M1423_01115 [Acidobacteria bacterium]|nr:hypothetical protein [Acidobacteriota bacterium]